MSVVAEVGAVGHVGQELHGGIANAHGHGDGLDGDLAGQPHVLHVAVVVVVAQENKLWLQLPQKLCQHQRVQRQLVLVAAALVEARAFAERAARERLCVAVERHVREQNARVVCFRVHEQRHKVVQRAAHFARLQRVARGVEQHKLHAVDQVHGVGRAKVGCKTRLGLGAHAVAKANVVVARHVREPRVAALVLGPARENGLKPRKLALVVNIQQQPPIVEIVAQKENPVGLELLHERSVVLLDVHVHGVLGQAEEKLVPPHVRVVVDELWVGHKKNICLCRFHRRPLAPGGRRARHNVFVVGEQHEPERCQKGKKLVRRTELGHEEETETGEVRLLDVRLIEHLGAHD